MFALEAGSDPADAQEAGKRPAFGPVVQGLFDRGQGESPFLQVSDQPQAVAVLGVVPAIRPSPRGGGEQSSVLVELTVEVGMPASCDDRVLLLAEQGPGLRRPVVGSIRDPVIRT